MNGYRIEWHLWAFEWEQQNNENITHFRYDLFEYVNLNKNPYKVVCLNSLCKRGIVFFVAVVHRCCCCCCVQFIRFMPQNLKLTHAHFGFIPYSHFLCDALLLQTQPYYSFPFRLILIISRSCTHTHTSRIHIWMHKHIYTTLWLYPFALPNLLKKDRNIPLTTYRSTVFISNRLCVCAVVILIYTIYTQTNTRTRSALDENRSYRCERGIHIVCVVYFEADSCCKYLK